MDRRERDRVNRAMRLWRQGDITFDADLGFTHIADLSLPHSEASEQAAGRMRASGREIGLSPEPVVNLKVPGLVVTTQTCDIVRDCEDRPWVDVSPLVRVKESMILDIKRWRIPRYGWVAATEGELLVADLDQTMSVEKAVASRWKRKAGWNTRGEFRIFLRALERKVSRPAFRDEFLSATKSLVRFIKRKHGKDSEEGKSLERLQEIRVREHPERDKDGKVPLDWWFIADDDSHEVKARMSAYVDGWMGRVDLGENFDIESTVICDMSQISALDYWKSDQMDFDSLSIPDEADSNDSAD